MVFAKTKGDKIDFLETESLKRLQFFSLSSFNFIFIPFFEIQIFQKQYLAQKLISRRPISNFSHISEDSLDFNWQ